MHSPYTDDFEDLDAQRQEVVSHPQSDDEFVWVEALFGIRVRESYRGHMLCTDAYGNLWERLVQGYHSIPYYFSAADWRTSVDRWLAANPGVVRMGVGWGGELARTLWIRILKRVLQPRKTLIIKKVPGPEPATIITSPRTDHMVKSLGAIHRSLRLAKELTPNRGLVTDVLHELNLLVLQTPTSDSPAEAGPYVLCSRKSATLLWNIGRNYQLKGKKLAEVRQAAEFVMETVADLGLTSSGSLAGITPKLGLSGGGAAPPHS